MKKNIFISCLVFIFVGVIVLNSCKKEAVVSDSLTQTINDDATSEKLFDDAFNYAERFGNSSSVKSENEDSLSCLTISVSGATFPRTVTLDFGTGCESANGVVRKGKIIVVTSQAFQTVGATRTVTFDNYYVNDYKIEGTKTITNDGLNSSNQPIRTVTLVGGKVTTPDAKIIERAFTRTRTWTEGYNTLYNLTDDVWQISGTTTGKSENGDSFTATIKTPLVVAFGCNYIKSGVLEIVSETKILSIDYGDGTCDDIAVITIDGNTKEIKLRNW